MSFPPDVYSRCLLGDYGYPLWTPQLNTELCESYQLEGLKIGDVGVLTPKSGSFDVLFNITLPPSHQPYPELVEDDFEPIKLNIHRDLDTQRGAVSRTQCVLPRGCVQVKSVQVHCREQEPSRADYEFSLSTGDGAVLILPEGADKCDLKHEKAFLDMAIRHGVSWYECATDPERAGRLINHDSLYLVTGYHKARSWSLGATDQNSPNVQNSARSLKFEVGQVQQDTITARAYYWTIIQGFMGCVGPEYPYEIPNYVIDEMRRGVNQTVFVRGFRITINKLLLFKTVSVETPQGTFGGLGTHIKDLLWGRSSDSSAIGGDATDNEVNQDFGRNSRVYADARMTINRVPNASQIFHPGDLINRYMLKKESHAVVAITHDNLWIGMLQTGLVDLEAFSNESHLEEVLSNNYRIIMEGNAVYLQKERSATGGPPHKHTIATILKLIGVTDTRSLGNLSPAYNVVQQMVETFQRLKLGQERWKVVIQRAALIIKELHENPSQIAAPGIQKFQRKLEKIQNILETFSDMSFLKALLRHKDVYDGIERANSLLDECQRLHQIDFTWLTQSQRNAEVSDQDALRALLKVVVGNYEEIRHRFNFENPEEEDQAVAALEREVKNTRLTPDGVPVEVQIMQTSLDCIRETTGRTAPKQNRWLITEYDLDFCGTIGGGGFSTVTKARYKGKTVAVKILKDVGDMRESLEREIEIWTKLRHNHIVRFYGASTLTSAPYIVSRYMRNGNLVQYLVSKPDADRTKLVLEVSLGMYYLHKKSIVHGDLKGVNILVDDTGKACITDFGLSKVSSGEPGARTGKVAGTLRYLAPEALKGHPLSFETDVYAFGMVIYEVFTGEGPFLREPDKSVWEGLVELRRPTMSQVYERGFDDTLWQLLSKCVSREPSMRPRFKAIREELRPQRRTSS